MRRLSSLWILLVGAPLIISCGSNINPMSGASEPPRLVQAANGANLDISCLQQSAQQIESAAQSSPDEAQQVAMQCNIETLASSAQQLRGISPYNFYSSYYYPGATWAATYYPPYYYYNANNFVNYLYGGNYNFNGLAVLGYGNYSYPYSYYYSNYGGNPYCSSSCLAGSWNYSSCLNNCIYQANLYY